MLLFIVPLLVVASVSEWLLRNIPNDYKLKKEYLDKNSNTTEVLVVGSSYAFYGLDPAYFSSRKSFNASNISQPIKYDYIILEKYADRLQNLKCIVLPVSYFTSYGNLEASEEAWRIKNYIIYYDLDLEAKFAYHSEVLSNKLMINIERIYSYYIKGKSNISCSELGWGLHFTSKHKLDMDVTGLIAAKRHTANSDKYFEQNMDLLKEIIEFAKKRNVDVILLTAPAFHTYVDRLDKSNVDKLTTKLIKFDSDYDNVTYTNLLQDTSFKETDFYDADHLNEIGAKKLSVKVDSLINGKMK